MLDQLHLVNFDDGWWDLSKFGTIGKIGKIGKIVFIVFKKSSLVVLS